MSKQIQEAYIVAATRTPVGKAPRGMLRHVRPDDMLVHVVRSALAVVMFEYSAMKNIENFIELYSV